jgi:hypothetical protein
MTTATTDAPAVATDSAYDELVVLYNSHGARLQSMLIFDPERDAPAYGNAMTGARVAYVGPVLISEEATERCDPFADTARAYDRPDLFWMALHELGHIALEHGYPCSDEQRLACEIPAWQWALDNSPRPLCAEGRKTLICSLASYGLDPQLLLDGPAEVRREVAHATFTS